MLDELATFVEAVEQGSLGGAARELGLPKSTVSRRLSRLEDELGQQLVQRHARLFRLTEAGDTLYKQAAAAVRSAQEAARFLRDGGGGLRGDLRVTLPQDLGASLPVVRVLAAFREAFPEVRLTLDLSDRNVDLAAEGFDFGLRAHRDRLQDSTSLVARRLGPVVIWLFASPAYLDRRGRPATPAELGEHHCVVDAPGSGTGAWSLRRAGLPGAKAVEVAVRAGLRASSMSFLPPAAVAGAGVAAFPVVVGESLVEQGLLERVLPAWELPRANLSLVWPARRLPSPRARAFQDFVVERLVLPS